MGEADGTGLVAVNQVTGSVTARTRQYTVGQSTARTTKSVATYGRVKLMIVKERVVASGLFSDEALARPGASDAVREELIRTVIAEGDKSAWRIRRESVVVYADGHTPETMQSRISAVWSPRVARFLGGEYDGEEMEVRRSEEDGLPPDQLTLPYRSAPTFESDAKYPSVTVNPRYSRVGTHPIDDAWVYVILR